MNNIYKSNRANEILRYVLGVAICIAVPTAIGAFGTSLLAPFVTYSMSWLAYIPLFAGIGTGILQINNRVKLITLQPQEGTVVNFMGKNTRVVESDVVCLYNFPFQIKEQYSTFITLKSRTIDLPAKKYITKDNINLSMDFDYIFYIDDLLKYTVEASQPEEQLKHLIGNAILRVVSEKNFEELKLNKNSITEEARQIVLEDASKLGIKVTKITCKSVQPDDETQAMLERQKEAELAVKIAEEKRKAAKIEAASEADKIEQIKNVLENAPLDYLEAIVATVSANKGIPYYPRGANQLTTAEAMLNTKLDSIKKQNDTIIEAKTNEQVQSTEANQEQTPKKVKVLPRKK